VNMMRWEENRITEVLSKTWGEEIEEELEKSGTNNKMQELTDFAESDENGNEEKGEELRTEIRLQMKNQISSLSG
jgi:hypothetical protein